MLGCYGTITRETITFNGVAKTDYTLISNSRNYGTQISIHLGLDGFESKLIINHCARNWAAGSYIFVTTRRGQFMDAT